MHSVPCPDTSSTPTAATAANEEWARRMAKRAAAAADIRRAVEVYEENGLSDLSELESNIEEDRKDCARALGLIGSVRHHPDLNLPTDDVAALDEAMAIIAVFRTCLTNLGHTLREAGIIAPATECQAPPSESPAASAASGVHPVAANEESGGAGAPS